ncbi:MAG: DUF3761 domain-containing protein [Pseudomonadota bacterium]|nr:DUF3761 domain-containing protein [Pseudomonadota bacterium]
MKNFAISFLVVAAIGATAAFAAVPLGAPAGSMGMCKDGTYSSSAEKKGACRGHKGVKDWYGETAATEPVKPMSERAPAPPPSGMATTGTSKPALPAVAGRTSGSPMEPAAGGGAGKVWANTSTKVYHCSGDKYYGTTKHGDYMTESEAKAKGYHADHGKACV